MMIAIIDYGMGNVGSIQNMLIKIGVDRKNIILAHKEKDLIGIDKMILPGVGKFDTGMQMLENSGMKKIIDKLVLNEKRPILGICLGMQMLGESSEEGVLPGLSYIPFQCKKFRPSNPLLKVPHMGWDYVDIVNKNNPLVKGMSEKLRFYFVHSYYAVCEEETDSLITCDYSHRFTAAVNRDNIFGTQFHPEKSHKFGMMLLKNFVEEI